ncbi:MAG: zinc-binding dehydrogenase [Actinomycetes bacterium]
MSQIGVAGAARGAGRASRPVEIRDLTLAAPGPAELRIRVRAAGICHSDLSVVNGSRPRPVPMVLGHEAAGEVLEVGSEPSDFQVGDRVVLAFVPSCGQCGPCLAGRPALCEPGAAANAAGTLLSGERRWTDRDGSQPHHHLGVSAFAQETVVSEHSAVKIPDKLPFEVAAVFGCAALTGAGAAINAAQVQPGESVAIFGLGGVGLAALLGAKLAGAGQIVAIDPVDSKRALAESLGAHATLSGRGDTVGELKSLTAGGPAKVIETAGSARVLETAYLATGRGGTTVTVGLPDPSEVLKFPAVSLVTEERTLKGSYLGSANPREMLPRLFDDWSQGNFPLERLISHRLTLDEINEGFDRLAAGTAVRQIIVP